MTFIDVQGVSKSFDGKSIIEDTSFSVDAGDTIAFTSPSGSGKSTLLSIVGLLLRPDSGSVVVEGGGKAWELDDVRLSALRRDLVGFVFQTTQLVGSLRAVENVTAPASFAGSSLDFDPERRAKDLLEGFGMGEKMYHYPHQLSVGQRRRIAVARALLLKPKVIIADEPTNDLDEESAGLVADALFGYAAEGNALLCATHIQSLAERAARVMTLQGKTFV